ncbi:MAG: hypothetical protein AAF549_09335 [Pseudomonadota bacterium]
MTISNQNDNREAVKKFYSMLEYFDANLLKNKILLNQIVYKKFKSFQRSQQIALGKFSLDKIKENIWDVFEICAPEFEITDMINKPSLGRFLSDKPKKDDVKAIREYAAYLGYHDFLSVDELTDKIDYMNEILNKTTTFYTFFNKNGTHNTTNFEGEYSLNYKENGVDWNFKIEFSCPCEQEKDFYILNACKALSSKDILYNKRYYGVMFFLSQNDAVLFLKNNKETKPHHSDVYLLKEYQKDSKLNNILSFKITGEATCRNDSSPSSKI